MGHQSSLGLGEGGLGPRNLAVKDPQNMAVAFNLSFNDYGTYRPIILCPSLLLVLAQYISKTHPRLCGEAGKSYDDLGKALR